VEFDEEVVRALPRDERVMSCVGEHAADRSSSMPACLIFLPVPPLQPIPPLRAYRPTARR
jgi:hypothetical protein